jgi:hypothetical protein
MSGIKIENRPDSPDINLYEHGHLSKRSKKHLDNKGNHEWVEVIDPGKDVPILGEARRSLERLYRKHRHELCSGV